MTLDDLISMADRFEKLAQSNLAPVPAAIPGNNAEKAAKDREVKERVKEIKLLADAFEKKFVSHKIPGFVANFSIIRDLNKVKSYLEDALKTIEKA